MRLFGSDRVAKMMDKMGLEEGEVIQHSMMTKTIERAQKKVEENNFGIRKRLLEYDDVMNAQREVVYKRRKHALEGNRLKVDIANMIYDTTEIIVENNKHTNSYKDYEFDIIRYFSLSSQFTKDEFEKNEFDEIVFKTYKSAYDHYNTKMKISAEKVFPIIKNVYENPSNNFERIVVPFTDGKKTLNVVSDLKLAYKSKGETLINDFEKNISLAIIDEAWKNHLRKMDELKQSVQLAVHEQKDPLIIYKFESFELFKTMLDKINREIISFLFKGELPSKDPSEIREDRRVRRKQKLNLSKEEVLNSDELASRNRNVGENVSSRNEQVETIVREVKKIGRNEKVTIKNITNGEQKTLKYKVAENHLKNGDWIIVND
jgi:preprotein translocase subunit SecA